MADTTTKTDTLPLNWDEWRKEWADFLAGNPGLVATRKHFRGKNFLADEILGTFKFGGDTIELSEITFPNLDEWDERGMLKRYDRRGIGITTVNHGTAVVWSFKDLAAFLNKVGKDTGD